MAERRKIYLTLHQCENWQELTDLLDSIKIATATIPLVPLARQPIKIGEKKYIRPVADDLEKWFYDNYNSNSEWDSELFDKFKTEHSISGLFTMPLSPEWNAEEPKLNAIGVTFDSGCFGAKYNFVDYLCSMWASHLSSKIFENFLNLALLITERLQPNYAAITPSVLSTPYGQEVCRVELSHIYWCNYFGPSYLQKYGEEIFLQAPGWRVKCVANGIWYQIAESPLDISPKLKEEILSHFRDINVKNVL